MTALTTELQRLLVDHSYAYKDAVKTAYDQGNDDGEGFAVGEEDQRPEEAAITEGYTVLSNLGNEHAVVCANDERVIAIGDAHGPWAVDITDLIKRD